MATSLPTGGPKRNDDGETGVGFGIPRSGGVKDAAWRIARGYPGGIKAMAQRLDLPYDTFQKKVNPSCETHHLQLDEAVDMQVFAERADILYAMAADLQHVCLPVPTEAMGEIGLRLMRVGEEVGDVFEVARRVLSDGKLEDHERKELRGHIADTVVALMAVLKGA